MDVVRILLVVCALGLGLLPACGPGERESSVLVVAAASSLRDLLTDDGASFLPADPEVEVRLVFGASSKLSRQAEEGADFDLLLSADDTGVDRLGNRIDVSTRRTFLSNRLALVGREGLPGAPRSPSELAGSELSLALAAPPVPAGRYAREHLSRVGVLDALQPLIVNAENVRAALAMVESGAADCALVYLSDARAATSAQLLWTATAASNPDIAYVAAALSRSASPWADAYLEWLDSEAFLEAAEARGFLRPR